MNWRRHVFSRKHQGKSRINAEHVRIQGSTLEWLPNSQCGQPSSLPNQRPLAIITLQSTIRKKTDYKPITPVSDEAVEYDSDDMQIIDIEDDSYYTPMEGEGFNLTARSQSQSNTPIIGVIKPNAASYSVTVKVSPDGAIQLTDGWIKL